MNTTVINRDNLHLCNQTRFDGNLQIAENLGIIEFEDLNVRGNLIVGRGTFLVSKKNIKAGAGIEAGWGIKAGTGIKAGWGIKAGDGIVVQFRCFAGLINWRLPTSEEQKIICKSFVGTIGSGELVLTK